MKSYLPLRKLEREARQDIRSPGWNCSSCFPFLASRIKEIVIISPVGRTAIYSLYGTFAQFPLLSEAQKSSRHHLMLHFNKAAFQQSTNPLCGCTLRGAHDWNTGHQGLPRRESVRLAISNAHSLRSVSFLSCLLQWIFAPQPRPESLT